jgi:nucleotide-binding universal stress UspA family protein
MSEPSARDRVLVVGVMPGQSDTVLTEAMMFATMLGARLVLASVDPTRYTTAHNPDGTVSAFPIDPDSADLVTEEFDPQLAEHVAAILEPSGLAWNLRALAGDPAHELARLAHEVDALAIVVGTRKRGLRTTAHEFFNGSVAVHLAHRQHHPVIVVPLDPVAHGAPLPWEE